jgi:hypothetical protein
MDVRMGVEDGFWSRKVIQNLTWRVKGSEQESLRIQ